MGVFVCKCVCVCVCVCMCRKEKEKMSVKQRRHVTPSPGCGQPERGVPGDRVKFKITSKKKHPWTEHVDSTDCCQ